MTGEDHGLAKRLAIEGRRIANQHARLAELWQQLLSAVDGGELETTHLAFRELRDGLIAHFDLEERIQIPALHGSNPGLQPALRRIVEEHTRFREALEGLTEHVEAGAFDVLRTAVARLHEGLSEHETFEENLFPGAKRP